MTPADHPSAGISFTRVTAERDAIAHIGDVINLPPGPVSALHQLLQPPRDFTGREDELTELLNAVQTCGVTISGFRGMGGVGKTALALKLAEQLTPLYPDAQFYLDLRGVSSNPLTHAEVMAHVVQAYDVTAKLPADGTELSALYHSKLHGQRALLLLDNAANSDQLDGLLPPPACLLIVTSRQHFTLPGLYAKDLDALPPLDARALLLRITPRIANHADEIARLCGCLPQALRWAASALSERTDLSPSVYLHRLRDATQRLRLTGMDASLSLSYDLLSPEMQTLWCQLAVFPSDFDLVAAAAVWALDDVPAQDAMSELVRYSLVEYRDTSGSEQGRYHLHDLARLFADSRMDADERNNAQYRHAVYYVTVLGAARDLYLKGGTALMQGLALFDQDANHIRAGQVWAASHVEVDNNAAQLCSDYAKGGSLHGLRLHPRERIQWLLAAYIASQKIRDRRGEGSHLASIGICYMTLGDTLRAVDYFKQALVISREIGDRYTEGNVLGNIGLAYANHGDTQHAIEFYKQQLVIVREIGDRQGEGTALGNIGAAYAIQGDPEHAIEFYEQALTIHRKTGDRLKEGGVLGNLGLVYAHLGNTPQAIRCYDDALVIHRETGNRRGVAVVSWNLGLRYEEQDDLVRAIPLMQVLVDYERELGHLDAEKHAQRVEALRAKLAGR